MAVGLHGPAHSKQECGTCWSWSWDYEVDRDIGVLCRDCEARGFQMLSSDLADVFKARRRHRLKPGSRRTVHKEFAWNRQGVRRAR